MKGNPSSREFGLSDRSEEQSKNKDNTIRVVIAGKYAIAEKNKNPVVDYFEDTSPRTCFGVYAKILKQVQQDVD